MNNEEWRVVEEAPNYLISNHGRVRNRISGNIIKEGRSGKYPTVSITKEGLPHTRAVHILVAIAFVEGRQPGLEVDHINGDKFNYLPENLEWVTHAENMARASRTGLFPKLKTWELQEDGSMQEIDPKKGRIYRAYKKEWDEYRAKQKEEGD